MLLDSYQKTEQIITYLNFRQMSSGLLVHSQILFLNCYRDEKANRNIRLTPTCLKVLACSLKLISTFMIHIAKKN
jgi:hypothetical protein